MADFDAETGEIIETPNRMPAEIAKAIIAVMKKVRPLGKDEENKFARFKYVSVDKFYEVIGQLMAEAGLFVVVEESSMTLDRREAVNDKGEMKAATWLTAVYEMKLFHEGGAEYGPVHRTIIVQATGPQSFGSGMSYVEKYFLRSLFKVPTGDEDAEAHPQDGMPAARAATRATPAVKPATPSSDVARAVVMRIRSDIKNSVYIEQLNARGIHGPQAAADYDLVRSQPGGEAVWDDLVKRDADRRLELSAAEAEDARARNPADYIGA